VIIQPLYYLRSQPQYVDDVRVWWFDTWAEHDASGRRREAHKNSIVCLLGPGEEFPVGTPDWLGCVRCFRAHVPHFHMIGDTPSECGIAEPGRMAIAAHHRLGTARHAMRRFLRLYSPICPVKQAHDLRKLVRPGD
jgi:hypothetical protein